MKTIILLAVVLFFVSCSHKKHKQEIQSKVEQSQVKDPAALEMTIDEAIANSKNLSPEEKQKLEAILSANKDRAMKLQQESYKLRGLLIEELLSDKMSPKKVKLLKKDIRKVEEDRLKNTFEAVDEITNIVSKYEDRSLYAQPLMILDRPLR